MARRFVVTLAAALALAALAIPARAQEAPKAPEAPKPPEAPKAAEERSGERGGMPGSTVRVNLVITRFQGEKKIASLPYTLVVGTGARTRMRMGVDTPVPVTQFMTSEQGGSKPSTSFQYRNVGTNIDCAVWERGRKGESGQPETVYRVSLSVENSSAFSGSDARGAAGAAEGAPLFRRFETSIDAAMRDGQTLQTIASTDPVTGEVVKIDVTLNVVK
jgi:hypothetical protein